MLSSRCTLTGWLYTALILVLLGVSNSPAPLALSAGAAVQDIPLIEFEDTGAFTRIHPTKIAIGQDRKLYFNSSLAVVYRIDGDGVLETVSMLPNAGGIPDDDFTVGITFDPRGDLYVSNVTGIYRIAAEDLRPQTLEQPVANVKIADIPEGLQFPMGLVADTKGHLYVSDILGGAIYKIHLTTGEGTQWFSNPALLAPNVFPSNNLFGVGFGLTDLAMDTAREHLYFGTQETHRIYRLGIDPAGFPGELEELAHVPGLAFNGVSFDFVNQQIYLAVPWQHFENGIQTATDPVEIAGSIWMIDLEQMDKGGVIEPVELLRDIEVGTAVDVVNGSLFGRGRAHADQLYVSDGSFDTFFWANGAPNGTPFPPDTTPEPGVPFPDNGYHAAIRIIELSE